LAWCPPRLLSPGHDRVEDIHFAYCLMADAQSS
jgi:hypothetical protein